MCSDFIFQQVRRNSKAFKRHALINGSYAGLYSAHEQEVTSESGKETERRTARRN